VEDFFRQRGLLLDFEITGGIPETLPRLLAALAPHTAGRLPAGGGGGGGAADAAAEADAPRAAAAGAR
jgi:hypothetical protein